MIYILKQRAQHLLVWNNAPPHIRKPSHNRRLSPIWVVNNMFRPDSPLSGWLKTYQVGQEYTLIVCVVNNMFRPDSPLSGRLRLLVNLKINYQAETHCWINTKINNFGVATGFTDAVNRQTFSGPTNALVEFIKKILKLGRLLQHVSVYKETIIREPVSA